MFCIYLVWYSFRALMTLKSLGEWKIISAKVVGSQIIRRPEYRFKSHGEYKSSFTLHAKQKCPFTRLEKKRRAISTPPPTPLCGLNGATQRGNRKNNEENNTKTKMKFLSFWTRKWPTSSGFPYLIFAFPSTPLSFLFAAVVDLLLGFLSVYWDWKGLPRNNQA